MVPMIRPPRQGFCVALQILRETRTASGYVLQDAPQSIELEPGKTAMLTFFNPTKPGISIKKIDADTNGTISFSELVEAFAQ